MVKYLCKNVDYDLSLDVQNTVNYGWKRCRFSSL